jgi:hypothetical protein
MIVVRRTVSFGAVTPPTRERIFLQPGASNTGFCVCVLQKLLLPILYKIRFGLWLGICQFKSSDHMGGGLFDELRLEFDAFVDAPAFGREGYRATRHNVVNDQVAHW